MNTARERHESFADFPFGEPANRLLSSVATLGRSVCLRDSGEVAPSAPRRWQRRWLSRPGVTAVVTITHSDNYGDLACATKKPAEDLTDEILTRLYSSVLTAEEVAELAKLVTSMRAHADTYVAADG